MISDKQIGSLVEDSATKFPDLTCCVCRSPFADRVVLTFFFDARAGSDTRDSPCPHGAVASFAHDACITSVKSDVPGVPLVLAVMRIQGQRLFMMLNPEAISPKASR